MRSTLALVLLATLGVAAAAQSGPKVQLHVLYLGAPTSERGRAFAGFLRERFARVTATAREGFEPASADKADVVVVDWPQHRMSKGPVPELLGKLGSWTRPTVLIGSAGLNLARAWETHGSLG